MLTGLFAVVLSFLTTTRAAVLADNGIDTSSTIWIIVGVLAIIALLIWIIKR